MGSCAGALWAPIRSWLFQDKVMNNSSQEEYVSLNPPTNFYSFIVIMML
jgi:hypothetical protein